MLIAFARTLILYLLLVIGVRFLGKRQVGELEPTELVLAMLISDLASVPMQDFGIPLIYGIIPIVCVLCVTMLSSYLTMKSVRFRLLLCGQPTIVVKKGVILQKQMNKIRMTPDELMEELRLQSVTDIRTVKYAILETSGQLSVILYANQQPVTPTCMDIPVQESGLPLTIIDNGVIYRQNLRRRGLDQNWLKKELASHGLTSPREVFLLTVDEAGTVYLTPKEEEG